VIRPSSCIEQAANGRTCCAPYVSRSGSRLKLQGSLKTRGTVIRIATFNLEDLFTRPMAMNRNTDEARRPTSSARAGCDGSGPSLLEKDRRAQELRRHVDLISV